MDLSHPFTSEELGGGLINVENALDYLRTKWPPQLQRTRRVAQGVLDGTLHPRPNRGLCHLLYEEAGEGVLIYELFCFHAYPIGGGHSNSYNVVLYADDALKGTMWQGERGDMRRKVLAFIVELIDRVEAEAGNATPTENWL